MSRQTDPAVWILWVGEGEAQAIHSAYGTRDAACAKLCDLVLRGQELSYPKITRQVVKDAGPINATNSDAVAKVISAYRGLMSVGKTDMNRASMTRLRDALEELCYPMAVAVDGTGHPVDSASPYREARKRVQDRNPHGEHPADVPAGRNPGPIDLGEDPDGDLDGYDGRR